MDKKTRKETYNTKYFKITTFAVSDIMKWIKQKSLRSRYRYVLKVALTKKGIKDTIMEQLLSRQAPKKARKYLGEVILGARMVDHGKVLLDRT
jgi:hypothetical protein